MTIRNITEPITLAEAGKMAKEFYGDVVKGVVDVEREITALGGEWHMDANRELIADGSLRSMCGDLISFLTKTTLNTPLYDRANVNLSNGASGKRYVAAFLAS